MGILFFLCDIIKAKKMEKIKLYDFNCDLAQSYGVYKNEVEFEIAKYASSVNISAGFHAGDPVSIRRALLFARDNNIALGAHVGYCDIAGFGKRKMELDDEELSAVIIYQTGAIIAYAKTLDLEIEQVRFHGALKDKINNDEQGTIVAANAVKKVSAWLNVIVQNVQTKEIMNNIGVKTALEAEFDSTSSIRQIRELDYKVDTIHFKTLEDIKRAYDIIKPTPINYNRVQSQI